MYVFSDKGTQSGPKLPTPQQCKRERREKARKKRFRGRRGLRSSALSIYHSAEGKIYFLFYTYQLLLGPHNLSLKLSGQDRTGQPAYNFCHTESGGGRELERARIKIEKYAAERGGWKVFIITHQNKYEHCWSRLVVNLTQRPKKCVRSTFFLVENNKNI